MDMPAAIQLNRGMPLQRETVTDGGLELYPEAGSAANIGIMLVKPNAVPLAKVRRPAPALIAGLGY